MHQVSEYGNAPDKGGVRRRYPHPTRGAWPCAGPMNPSVGSPWSRPEAPTLAVVFAVESPPVDLRAG